MRGPARREAFATWQSDLSTPGAARAVVRELLQGSGLEELMEDALLLTSELVTNVVRHAPGAAALHAELYHDGLRISVHDRAEVLAARRAPAAQAREEGRGLEIVEQVASAWSSTREGGGKVTWFELRSTRAAPTPHTPA